MVRGDRILALTGAVFAGAAALVIAVVVAGAALPVEHQLTAERTIDASCQEIWRALTDYEGQPAWREDLVRVSRVPNRLGSPAWMEYYSHGERMIVSEVRAEPPGLLELGLDDQTGPYAGRWSFALEDRDGACAVRLEEQASSRNPMFRFVWHYLVGERSYAERYLEQLDAQAAG